MSSLTLRSVSDRIAYTPSWGQNGSSVKKSAGRYGKRCSRTRFGSGQKTTPRGRLLEQLEVCCEELNVAIMAELDERERINQELRDQVHQELDIARGLIYYTPGLEGLKKAHAKLESIVIDRSKRIKSDNLRKLLEHIKVLQKKAESNEDKPSKAPVVVVEPVTSTTSTPVPKAAKVTAPLQSPPIVSPTKPATPASAPVESTKVVPADSSPKVTTPRGQPEIQNNKPAEEESRPPREIISEAAKQRQKPQIPWRTPTRLEPLRDPRGKPEQSKKNDDNNNEPPNSMPEQLPLKEPERLALRYKVRKRPADESLPPPKESQFKKPFALPEVEPQKPLFQRRHQLAPASGGGPRVDNLPVPSRDPRNYGDYCNRRMTLMQNRARFERQNQQYFPPQRQHELPARPPVATAHQFAVPAPVAPTAPAHRPPAPKASVAPNSSRPVVEPAAPPPAAVVVRNDTRKTNPVYGNDEPIRLGKKDDPKKQVSPTKPAEEPEPKPVEKEVEKKVVEEPPPPEKPAVEAKKTPTQKEKDNALEKNLMELLKDLGDDKKAQQILDVMGKKSDDEAEEQPKKQQQEEAADQEAKRRKTPAEKKAAGKKFKRIRAAKPDESSSEDEAAQKQKPPPAEEQTTKKEKAAKPAPKRASGGSREVSALIENSSDWMAKGSVENHYTRRRGTAAVQQLISPPKNQDQDKNSSPQVISDEEGAASSKQRVEDPLLEVAKVVPAGPTKGKQKAKESAIVYNDKKTVHCNSNYSSNCALCSFNGSAIVDHYVYDHKTYEVFVSRVSPKMADIIRSDLFVTNGTLVNVGDSNEEKIRFKCYFCLAPKELGRVEWTDHLSAHTGEYRYRCTSCPVMSRTEELGSKFFHEKSCLKPTLAIYNNIEFEDNHLYGFICDACNFIQIRRVNMERHLKREHPSSDVTCSRFSILNYKVETKPIVDEELLMMADLSPTPTVMIPFTAKSEPMDTYEIVNQPFTEDEEMPEPPNPQLQRRTEIRMESVHIGQVGASLPSQLAQLPFTIKAEPGLQQEASITSSHSYESPMSPEPSDSSEAQPSIPVLQIECVSGGVDLSEYSAAAVKLEKPDDGDGCESDASDATVDLDLSGEGRQCATDTNQQGSNNGGTTTPTGSESSGSGGAGSGSGTSGSGGQAVGGGGGGAGAAGGGDGGDDRKKEEFPVPLQIKVEKDEAAEEEEKRKKQALEGVTTALENVKVKTEKPDRDSPELDSSQYDFVELVLDSKRMQYVAYVERNAEALFLCILPGCKFITKVADNLSNHIARKHSRVLWDGYCQICRSQITPADCSITEEFQHLLTIHARKKTPPLETPTVPSAPAPNVIRIRKMPGDTLSLADASNPPPLMPITAAPPVPVQAFASPIILQPGMTISPAPGPVPVALNQLFTPTHTIPAQIRPITATVGPNITVTPVSRPPSNAVQSGPMRTVRLKPWTNMVTTKSQEHCRDMLEEVSLLCLFKCMSRACAFTSNNRVMMAQHLANHDQVYRGGPTSMRKCWLECAYCDLIAPNSADLLVHIDTEHANCGFQCNLCFYRSRDPTNVVVHQKDHHPASDTPKKILIMPDNLKSFGNEEWLSMQESLRQHVLPLHCTICKESFYILSAYMTHLTSHSQSLINCQVCHATIDKKVMARHLLQHSIGLYECVYCLFGANTKSTMALHVSNAHSSKPLYCCVRYNKQRMDGVEYPPNKIESMELKTMSCTVSPDLFKRCNYTQAELNFKPTDLETNRTMTYRRVTAIGSSASSMEQMNAQSASNIQIQITDEAGRPLIISIPVKNPAQPAPPVPVPGPSTATPVAPPPVPVAIHSVQMPTISTVQGGVTIQPSLPPILPKPAPLPVISAVQGSLPPLTAISQTKQPGLPIISNVQSIAQPPPLTINPTAVPRSSSPAVVSTSGVSTSYSIPATISAVGSTSTSDIYTTTVAEADTQSNSAAELVGAAESDGSGSKCSTPSPAPSSSAVTTTTSTTSTTTVGGGLKLATAGKKLASTTQIRIDFLFNGSIDKFDRLERKVSEMIKHTGFCGQELNACGVEKCNSRYSDPVKLNLHLLKHHSVSSYKCYHCTERFKTAHELITHIKTHGRHRYLCFLCDAKSHFLKMMIVHVQHDHKSSDVILTYLHPKKRDIHNDLVVICPQNVTQIQLQDYISNILDEDEATGAQEPDQPAKKKKFAPSEIDQLPTEDIFPEDLLCANCDYATKIRKNLKRHLEKHHDAPIEGVPVVVASPTLDPGPSPAPPATPPAVDEPTAKPTEPQQIAPDKLYQCGICRRVCEPVISEFRTHLYRVHRHEKVYRCPHCGTVVNNGFLCIDKIVNHLKLHREKLYKCSECEYYRDEKYLIPPHLKQNHAGVAGARVVAVRGEGVQKPQQPQAQLEQDWQCDLCETIRRTREEMVEHMTGDHKLSDKQYKCSYCSYKSSDHESFKVHFAESHPKSEILIISLFHALPPAAAAAAAGQKSSVMTALVGGTTASTVASMELVEPGTAATSSPTRKRFSCGSEGCSFASLNLAIVKKHFQDQHPEESLVVFDDTGTEREKRKRFDYFVKYGCVYCADKFPLMDDVIEHWYNTHMGTGERVKPLMFKLFKLVRCVYCDKLATHDEVKEHVAAQHIRGSCLPVSITKMCSSAANVRTSSRTTTAQIF
uniref:C2H2-type domain-containing protein n=1 Tax=Culex tarsalis TaxID=7177 RepID=A0A1Q3FVZ5_CULTA